MLHMVQKHISQQLIQDSVAQLRHLDRAACVLCDTIRSRRCHRCSYCKSDTPTRDFSVGDAFQGRQPGHQDAAPKGMPTAHQPPRSSQPVPPGDLLDDSPLPNCSIRDIVLTERDKQSLADLRRASAMAFPRCKISRHATAWAESLEGTISVHQSCACCADIVAACCWLRSQKALTETQN